MQYCTAVNDRSALGMYSWFVPRYDTCCLVIVLRYCEIVMRFVRVGNSVVLRTIYYDIIIYRYVLRVVVDCSVLGNVRRKAVGGVAALTRARFIKRIRGEDSSGGAPCRGDTSRGSRTYTRTRTYVINVYVSVCICIKTRRRRTRVFSRSCLYYNIICILSYTHAHVNTFCASARVLLRREA